METKAQELVTMEAHSEVGDVQSKNQDPATLRIAPNPTSKYWREVGQELVKSSVASVEEAGKQVIAVAGILEGFYFNAIAYSGLRGTLPLWQISLYLVPVALWLISLAAALSVFYPIRHQINISSSEICKESFEEIATGKLIRFRVSAIFLGLGVAAVIPLLIFYLN